MSEAFERRVRHDPTEDDPSTTDDPIYSETPAEENLDQAQEADDLEKDPDEVANRTEEAQPPTPETVGPWDDDNRED